MTSSRRSRTLVAVLAFACAGFSAATRAEVKNAAADTFQLQFVERVAVTPAAVYAAIGQVDRWWTPEHSYSGDAANLTLAMVPGGCFCERWKDGAVEHGRVIMLMRDQVVRLQAPLGPLQNLAVNAVLTFLIKAENGATTLTVGYRVNGASASGLDKLATPVDGVLGENLQRLKRYVETGKPGI